MRITVFIVAFFILFRPVFPLFEYVANYEYIAKVLCVNKEKPAMKCNGKCHLMKELAKTAEDSKPVSDKKHSVKEIEILFFYGFQNTSSVAVTFPLFAEESNPYNNHYSFLGGNAVFHPPTSIS